MMEGGEPPFLITQDNLERVLFARLSTTPESLPSTFLASDPEAAPFKWLIRSYDRCYQETRKTMSRDKAYAESLSALLAASFELCVSYSGLLLNPAMEGMFPQPPAATARGALQLFDEMTTGETGLPPGFLEAFANRFAEEGLPEILAPTIAQLPNAIRGVSPLGEVHRPLSVLCSMTAIKPVAAVLSQHPRWCPSHPTNGRAFEDDCVLGAFFSCSALPDVYPASRPSVREQCFSNLHQRRPGDVEAAINTLRTTSGQVADALFQALYAMLRHGGETREAVVRWMAASCNSNAGRSKMQIQPLTCASHGGAVNLAMAALRLAAPFSDPGSRKFTKIDPNYVRSAKCRLDLSEVTRVAAATEAVEAGKLPAEEEPTEAYGFICECFFLTARAMHLGYVKCIAEQTQLARELQDRQQQMNDVEGMRANWAASIPGGPSQFQVQQFDRRVEEMKAELAECKESFACFDTVLQDPKAVGEAMQFYRLVATWLIWVATGGKDATGGSQLAAEAAAGAAAGDGAEAGGDQGLLPVPCTPQFALLPEHLLEDMADFLLYVCRFAQHGHNRPLDNERLDELMSLFILLLGSPEYVKNPYLRAKFVEVLRHWLPGDPENPNGRWNPRMANLFEGHPLALAHLVPSLLRLYVDIEFTGGANQFYDKFNIRYQIGEICEYLWKVEPHRRAWGTLAKSDSPFYMRFLNMLINDAIWLLDESLKKLPEVREFDAETADQVAWSARPARERAEREAANRQTERALRNDLVLAKVHVRMMGYTSRDIAAPFLLPEMVERVAAMLNYFLLFLAGPQRRQLKVKDPEKYGWNPKELLTMIADVYLNLFDADTNGAFVAAIAADGRSYRDEVFTETATVLRMLGLKSDHDVCRFEELAEQARLVAAAAEEEEADLGEVPDDFMDPIMCTLMTDPVKLPSGDTMDRANIMRHLLTDETNPFTRQPLKVADLVPDTELKGRIDAWIAERKALAGGGGKMDVSS